MKVLIVSPTFPPMRSGGADFAWRLCERLSERGVEVHAITSAVQDIAHSEKFSVSAVMTDWGWRDLAKLRRLAREFRPDVVEIHFAGAIYNHHPMITCLPALLKKWLPSVRVVLHIEYPQPVQEKRLRSPTRMIREAIMLWCGRSGADYGYGTLLRESDQITLLCDTHRESLARQYKEVERKSVTITQPSTIKMSDEANGLTRQQGRAQLQVASDAIVLVYYGYIYPNKGIETLLEAFGKAAGKIEKARLLMLGGANEIVLRATNRPHYLQEMRDLTEQLGIAKQVIWTDYFPTNSEQPSIFLRAADIAVLPFDDGISMHRSTFGVVASHHLPIITTQRKTLEAAFVDGENVLLCSPRDSQALADAIEKVIASPILQETLRNGARNLTEKYFSWEQCIDRRLAVLEGKPFS